MEVACTRPEYTLEIFAESHLVKEMLAGILHTIFFHRTFPAVRPVDRDILEMTLPAVDDVDLETLIEQRSAALVRQLEAQAPAPASAARTGTPPSSSSGPGISSAASTTSPGPASSASPYASPSLRPTAATAAAGTGAGSAAATALLPAAGAAGGRGGVGGRAQLAVQFFEKRRRKTYFFTKGDEEVCWEQWTVSVTLARPRTAAEQQEVRRAMERSLHKAAVKVLSIAAEDKDHIPPITTSEATPFPYQIVLNPRPRVPTAAATATAAVASAAADAWSARNIGGIFS